MTIASGSNFYPSSVSSESTLVNGWFGQDETQAGPIAAISVTNFLASNGNRWDTEFSLADLMNWMRGIGVRKLNSFYFILMAAQNADGNSVPFFQYGLVLLVQNGYLTRDTRDGMDYLTATNSFVEAMRRAA